MQKHHLQAPRLHLRNGHLPHRLLLSVREHDIWRYVLSYYFFSIYRFRRHTYQYNKVAITHHSSSILISTSRQLNLRRRHRRHRRQCRPTLLRRRRL
jgi:hypothetical protein